MIRFHTTQAEVERIGLALDEVLQGEENPDACFVAVTLLVANLFANTVTPDQDDAFLARMVEMVREKLPKIRAAHGAPTSYPYDA